MKLKGNTYWHCATRQLCTVFITSHIVVPTLDGTAANYRSLLIRCIANPNQEVHFQGQLHKAKLIHQLDQNDPLIPTNTRSS